MSCVLPKRLQSLKSEIKIIGAKIRNKYLIYFSHSNQSVETIQLHFLLGAAKGILVEFREGVHIQNTLKLGYILGLGILQFLNLTISCK